MESAVVQALVSGSPGMDREEWVEMHTIRFMAFGPFCILAVSGTTRRVRTLGL